jgi:hypothetical protein
MWGQFCEVFAPNVEKQEFKEESKIEKAEDKYYKYAIVRYILRKIKR